MKEIKEILFKILNIKIFDIEVILSKLKSIDQKFQIKKTKLLDSPSYNTLELKLIIGCLYTYLQNEYKIQFIDFSTGESELQILTMACFIVITHEDNINDLLNSNENKILTEHLENFLFSDQTNVLKVKEENLYLKDELNRLINEIEEYKKTISMLQRQLDENLGGSYKSASLKSEINRIDEIVVKEMEDEVTKLRNRFEVEHNIIKNTWYKLASEILKKK